MLSKYDSGPSLAADWETPQHSDAAAGLALPQQASVAGLGSLPPQQDSAAGFGALSPQHGFALVAASDRQPSDVLSDWGPIPIAATPSSSLNTGAEVRVIVRPIARNCQALHMHPGGCGGGGT
jgi:hypothetical protein